jgi:hypothetical protein
MARKKSDTIDFKFRMKEPLRRKIEKAAKSNGVSMNTEAVSRLEASFNSEGADASAYGGAELSALFRMLGGAASLIEGRLGASCTKDYFTNIAVRAAWKKLIAHVAPSPPDEVRDVAYAKEPEFNVPPMPEPLLPINSPVGLLSVHEYAPGALEEREAKLLEREKAYEEYLAKRDEYYRPLKELSDEINSYQGIGEDVAAGLFPPHAEK